MEQEQRLKTGTTTLGIVYKDGALLASESKSTMGWLVASKTSQKIYQVSDKIAVTTAGGAGDTQTLVRILKAELNLYKMARNKEVSVKAAATLLQNILAGNRYYPYMAMLLVGGYDDTGPHVYSLDAVGGLEYEDKYAATGSGSPMALGVLEDSFRENMTKEEAVRLAVRAVRSARERDTMSGGRDIVVITIDKNGMEKYPKDKIDEIAK